MGNVRRLNGRLPDLTSVSVPQVAFRSLEILFMARDFSHIASEFNRFMDFGFTEREVGGEWLKRRRVVRTLVNHV